ncbi:hypothetical protein COCON_G00233760 [Conger conger]|uniref:Uncharacterized protein n=1 Tax=Conger conger TaxID=82655 RepID=A0A9Q1HME2_CONCO|nr:hypothetical protein COCON_G00233760 [Conger conger]
MPVKEPQVKVTMWSIHRWCWRRKPRKGKQRKGEAHWGGSPTPFFHLEERPFFLAKLEGKAECNNPPRSFINLTPSWIHHYYITLHYRHLADTLIQSGIQLIRLSRRQSSPEQCWVKGLAQRPNGCVDLIVATLGLEPLTWRVPVIYLNHYATGCPVVSPQCIALNALKCFETYRTNKNLHYF